MKSRYSTINSYLAHLVIDPNTGASLEFRHLRRGPDKILWGNYFSNELGRLANGVGIRMETGTNTIRFRERSAIPHNKKVTYERIVASLRPYKEEKCRVRLTVGRNLFNYDGDASTPTTDLTTTKVLSTVLFPPTKHDWQQKILKTPI